MNPRNETCDVRELINRVTRRMARYLSGRNLLIDLPARLPAVQGDRLLLEQMLIQVLDNAWKYSKVGAMIQVQASSSSQRVFITIQNEGGRIPAADCERELLRGLWRTGNRLRFFALPFTFDSSSNGHF